MSRALGIVVFGLPFCQENRIDHLGSAAAGVIMNKSTAPSIHPILVLFFGILAASTSSIFIRFAQAEVPSIVIASYRLSIAALILLPYAVKRHRSDLKHRHWSKIIGAGIFLAIHFGTWITSLEYTSVTSSVVLVQTTPIFVMLLSPFFLGETPARWTIIGLILALAGSAAIALSDTCALPLDHACAKEFLDFDRMSIKGDLLAIAGAVSGAAYLMLGRVVRKTMPLIPYITLVYGIAAVGLLVTSFISGLPLTGYSPSMYLWFLLLAIFPQLLAHSSYNWALEFLPANTVALSLLGEPVSASVLAFLILRETLPFLRWLGAMIIFVGIATALYQPRKTLRGTSTIDKMLG